MELSSLLLLLLLCCCSAADDAFFSGTSAVCADSRVPVVLPEPLGFCNDVGPISCCDSAADAALRKEYEAMDAPESDAAGAAMVMALLCEQCKPSPSPQPANAVTINSIPPRCGASQPQPPSPEKAGIPRFVWTAASISIPGVPITGFAIYLLWSRVLGGSRGEDEQDTGSTATSCSFTWNCRFAWACCFCGNTNDGNNAPTGGQGGCQLAEISAS